MDKSVALLIVVVILSIYQGFLAKKNSKRVGLILPLKMFILSLFLLTITPNFIESKLVVFVIFLLANIPTAIYFLIFLKYKNTE